MANSHNYVTADDCNATTAWSNVQNFTIALDSAESFPIHVYGSASVTLECSAATLAIARVALTGNEQFKVTERDFFAWFFYPKGKGTKYLRDASADGLVIRLYFGTGTAKYADYPQGGDDTFKFGWQNLICSGKNNNYGGTHNNGTDWDLTVETVEIRADFLNANNGQYDPPLFFDWLRHGTKIIVGTGTEATPIGFQDLVDFSTSSTLGVVTVEGNLVNLLCGLDFGDGTAATAGHLQDSGKFILVNQQSFEVKHDIIVENNSSLKLGILESGTPNDYPVDGCQIVQPANRYGKFEVKQGGKCFLFDSKLYRFGDVYFGNGSAGATIDLRTVDFDSNETVYFRQTNMTLDTIEIHDNANQVRDQASEISATPTSMRNVSVHDCVEGMHIRASVTLNELIAGDNTYDLGILEGTNSSLINSTFAEDKIKRLAT